MTTWDMRSLLAAGALNQRKMDENNEIRKYALF
jgi:hypothetical protein